MSQRYARISLFGWICTTTLCVGAAAQGSKVEIARILLERPASLQEFLTTIEVDNDPVAARLFLTDWKEPFKKQLDPTTYSRVFAHATELKDLDELVSGIDELSTFRKGLLARETCLFCQKPIEFNAWLNKYYKYLSTHTRQQLSIAFYNWNTLSAEQTKWLLANGQSPEGWDVLDLLERGRRISVWSGQQLAEMLTETPANARELKDYQNRAAALNGLLNRPQAKELWKRADEASARLSGLDKARKLIARYNNPLMKDLLVQANHSTDLPATLAVLEKIFDAAGANNSALKILAPPREEQIFDAARRARTAALLATALMKETDGTQIGEELRLFYAQHPLVVIVAPGLGSAYAREGNGELTFNEDHIQQYLKSKGLDIDSLATNQALLRGLAIQLSPLFVHEATHHRQEVWATETKIGFLAGQHLELEATQTESLFVIEKMKKDPVFHAHLVEDARSLQLARESLARARRLLELGPDFFRDSIKAWNYEGELSLEGVVWKSLRRFHTLEQDISEELVRRDTLSDAEKEALENENELPRSADAPIDRKNALAQTGSPFLRNFLIHNHTLQKEYQTAYDAYTDRLERINDSVKGRLAELAAKKITLTPNPSRSQVPSLSGKAP